MAVEEVLLEGCGRGAHGPPSPPTLRFLQFAPSAVLVGAYQSVEREVRLDYCRQEGIDVSRRLTGGGTIFFDRSQLGWEIICPFSALGVPSRPNEELFRLLARPVIAYLRELGLDAAYRPRNDIEVHGRKISGTGGTDLHGALLFQGTLLVDFDLETMLRALRVPVEKLQRKEIDSMRERVTWLSRELGRAPDPRDLRAHLVRHFEKELSVICAPGELSPEEQQALEAKLPHFESDRWVLGPGRPGGAVGTASYPTAGGVVHAALSTTSRHRAIQSVFLGGDFFVFPRRALTDLEAFLKATPLPRLSERVHQFFSQYPIALPGVGPEGICQVLSEAAERARGEVLGLTPRELGGLFAVGGSLSEVSSIPPSHLLLPYCAKPPTCSCRQHDDCHGCGECTVGEAYDLGRQAGLEVHSITSFEHLLSTLRRLRRSGATAFLGSCCEAFYIKHRRELEAVGLPGLLFDIANSETCYDLGKSSYAYRGEYQGETSLRVPLLRRILGPAGEPLKEAAAGESA